MSVASMLAWRLARSGGIGHGTQAPVEIKRGADAIFGDGPYPRRLSEFVGQEDAKAQLMTAMMAAAQREEPLDHVLLASGYPGIGKTALAKIVANMLNVGYAEVGGTVTLKDIRPVLHAMQDHDVLFIDEIHRMVSSGKRNAEWLLQVLQDGVLALPTGVERIAKITIIGATTDAQKLPETILSRFPIQPILEPYSTPEATAIAKGMATRLELTLSPQELHRVAEAANRNPRTVSRILKRLRDITAAKPDVEDRIALALSWTGVTEDGLTRQSADYMMVIYGYGGVAGVSTMKAALNEIALEHTEKLLIQKGFVVVTPKGRELTRLGIVRAEALLKDNPAEEAQ